MGVASEACVLEPPKKRFGVRHLQIILIFLAKFICYASRNNLNIALIAMTDKNNEQYFDISIQIQSTLQSSFFWGYFIGLLPAGEVVTKYGGRRFLILCLLVNSLASFTLPFSRFLGPNGWMLIYGCRIVQGLFQGLVVPAALTLISKWIPEVERSRMGSFTYSAISLGNAFQLLTSGYLADYFGWPSIFYFYTILGILWIVVYAILGAESPAQSKFISNEERTYIQTALGYSGKKQKLSTPWVALMTSLPYISTIVALCGFKWGYYTLLTQIPTYMNRIHSVNLRENGQLSALPYLTLFLVSYPTGYLADFILLKKWFKLTAIRKLFSVFGFFGPAICLIALSQVTGQTLAVAFLTLAVALNAGSYSGVIISQLDMAPNYPGSMNAIANVFSNLMSILAPIVAGVILGDGTDVTQWQMVFYLSVAIYIASCVFYLIFGDSTTQPWNDPDYKKAVHQ